MSEHERVVAFTELGKIFKKVDAAHTETTALLDELLTAVWRGYPDDDRRADMGFELNRCLKDAVVTPFHKRFAAFSSAVEGESAELAQDALLDFMRLYNSKVRYWLINGAHYANRDISKAQHYEDWDKANTALWACIYEHGKVGPLRRMASVLEAKNEEHLIPKEMPTGPPNVGGARSNTAFGKRVTDGD